MFFIPSWNIAGFLIEIDLMSLRNEARRNIYIYIYIYIY
jgi:hypothetical protein